MDPGPTPTFTASTPALMRACAPARVAIFPPMMSMDGKAARMRATDSSTAR